MHKQKPKCKDQSVQKIYGDKITGMSYHNTLLLAILESLKTEKLNSVGPFLGKYSPVTVACILFAHPNVIMNFFLNYLTP